MKRKWQPWLLLFAIVLFGIAHPSYAWSDDDPLASNMRSTIERVLKFIQEDAVKWRNEKTCSTCHHGSMTMWVQLEARSRGFEISEEILQENVKWAKERILERVDLPRDIRPGWSMVNTPAIYMALTAHAVPTQEVISADDLQRVGRHLLRHQEDNGAWMWSSAPPKNIPPPFFESDEVATRLAWLALAPLATASAEDAQTYRISLTRAEEWLKAQQPAQTTQTAVLRLVMTLQSSAPPEDVRAAVNGLIALQNADGGWSQLPDRPSDAYATGQVLYALCLTEVAPDAEPILKGVQFLIRTQRDDGSWPMTRRTQTDEPPSQNMIPITYFGSAWATLGLMRSLPATTVTTP